MNKAMYQSAATDDKNKSSAADPGLRRTRFLLLGVLLLATLLRLHEMSQQSFWYDELATWHRAVIPLGEMFADLFAVRNHTPLYFLAMRLWVQIGEGEFVLRYFSFLWGIVGVALTYRLGALVGGRRAGLMAAFLLAISPFHIWYSQEARMYTMLAALAVVANWCLLSLLRRERRWLWLLYALSLALALYTHFLALFLPVAHYAYLSIHYRRLRAFFLKWLMYAAAAVLIFAVWGGAMLLTGGFREAPISWIPAARLYEPLLTVLSLSIGPSIDPGQPLVYFVPLLFLFLTGYGFVRFGRRLPGDASDERVRLALDYRLLLIWFAIPVLLIYFISLDLPIPEKRSVYVDRYLLMSQPAMLIAVAWGLDTLAKARSQRWLRPAALLVVTLISALTLSHLYADSDYWREDWRSALAFLRETAEPGDVVLGRPDHLLPLDYYGVDSLDYAELPAAVTDEALLDEFDQEMTRRVSLAAAGADRAWLITHAYVNDPHGFPQERNDVLADTLSSSQQKEWMETNYAVLQELRSTGIELTLYDLAKPATLAPLRVLAGHRSTTSTIPSN
jgi:hypothetical protein